MTTDGQTRQDGPGAEQLFAIYLRHHAAAARAGLGLFRRTSRAQLDHAARTELRALAVEVEQDRLALLTILASHGIRRPRFAELLLGWSQWFGQLKPNGTLVRRSPLSDLLELEALSVAVDAKRLGWLTLQTLADVRPDRYGDLSERLDSLVTRAEDQKHRIEQLRRQAVVDIVEGVDRPTAARPG